VEKAVPILFEISSNLNEIIGKAKEIVMEMGILRLSDFVIDLIPRKTFSTEIAIPASLIALLRSMKRLLEINYKDEEHTPDRKF